MSRSIHTDGAPARLIAHLQQAEVGTRMSRDEIAAQFGIKPTSVSTTLKGAIDRGELTFTMEGTTRLYHLPLEAEDDAPANDGPLTITADSAGDLWFTGATLDADENSCLLTQAQLQQLVEFATKPPIRREGAAHE